MAENPDLISEPCCDWAFPGCSRPTTAFSSFPRDRTSTDILRTVALLLLPTVPSRGSETLRLESEEAQRCEKERRIWRNWSLGCWQDAGYSRSTPCQLWLKVLAGRTSAALMG